MKSRKGTPGEGERTPDGAAAPRSETVGAAGQPSDDPGEAQNAPSRAELTLRAIQAQVQTLVGALPLAMITLGRDERVQMWNPAAERIFGWKAEEVIGGPLPLLPEGRYEDFRARFETDLRGGQQDGVEVPCLRKDGSLVEVSVWTVPLLDDAGEIAGTIAFVADISPRQRAEAAATAQARQLEVVRSVTDEIARELDLTTLLGLITKRATDLVGAQSGTVFLWDEDAQVLIPTAWHGFGPWRSRIRLRSGEGVAGVVAARRQGLVVTDYHLSPYAHDPTLARTRITAVIGEPVLYRDRLVGVITVDRHEGEPPFTEKERETLGLFTGQAAIAIENATLFQQERKRAEQLETVRTLSAEITKELGLSNLLRMINRQSVELLGGGSGAVVLWDAAAQNLVPAAWQGHGDWYGSLRWRLGEGMVGTVAARREGLVVNDYRNSPFAHPLFLLRTEITASLVEPLLYRDRLLGVVTVDHYEMARSFTGEDQRLLNLFASQAAIAIENGRLYGSSESRANELQVLGEISQAIASRLELPAVLQAVVAGAMRILDNPFGQIILWEEATQTLRFGAAQGPEAERVRDQHFELGRGINGVVAQTRQPMILDDYQVSAYRVPECHDIVATITVPILFGDRLLGVLHSHSTATGRRFGPDDLRRLQSLATHAAIAIENARLYEVAQRELADRRQAETAVAGRNRYLEEIRKVAAEITRELDLPTVLNLIIQRAVEIVGVNDGVIRLWDEGEHLLVPKAMTGFPATRVVPALRLGEGLTGAAAQRREGMIVNDYRNSPYARPQTLAVTTHTATMAEPLVYRGRLLGVITIDNEGVNGRLFAPEDQQVLHLFADHAAIAIENARLHEAAVRRADEMQALLEASRAIESTLDLTQRLQAIVEQAAVISGAQIVRLFHLDEEARVLRCKVGVGFPLEEELELVIPVGVSLSGQVAATGELVQVSDTGDDPRTHYPGHVDKYGVVSYLGLPVKFQDRVFGVLVFNTPTPRTYAPEEITFLNAFAQQAAVAIQNAWLYEAAQNELAERIRTVEELKRSEEQARRLAQENATMAEIGRIISSTLNIEEVYENFAHEVRKLLPFDRIVINCINEAENVVRNVYIAGEGLQDRNTSDLYPLQGSGNAETVRTRASLLIQTEDFREYQERFPALASTFQAGFRSILNVPLLAKGQVIGGLLLRSRQPNAYTEQDVWMAERICSQIAGTIANAQLYIENVRLYEVAQREILERQQIEESLAVRTRHLETIRSISEEIARELNLTTLLDLIIHRAMELLGAPSGTISLWNEEGQVLVPKLWPGLGEWRKDFQHRPGEGVANTVAQRRTGMIVNEYRTSPYAHAVTLAHNQISAVVAEPLIYRDRLVGVLAVHTDRTDHAFTEEDRSLLALFANQAAIAIENARLHEASIRKAEQLATLNQVTRALTTMLVYPAVLQAILTAVQTLFPGAGYRLFERVGEEDTFRLVISSGLSQPKGGLRVRFRPGEGLLGVAIANMQPVISIDVIQDPRFVNKEWAAAEGLVSCIALPLIYGAQVTGALAIFTHSPSTFSDEEVSLLQSFAAQAAIAIENARLHEDVQRQAAELEARVRERTTELEEALRVKAEFLARMSHELCTPLNHILGFAELLGQGTIGALSPKQAQFVDRIHTGGKHLLALVSDLLDLSHAEGEKRPLQLEAIPLAAHVQEVLALFDIRVGQKRLTLTADIDPALHLVAERRKLTQILTNLVGNAVKFTPEQGTITVTAKTVRPFDSSAVQEGSNSRTVEPSNALQSQWIEIAVADTGIGLAPEDRERIFRGFEQVDGSMRRQYEGAGVGLALVRTLVQMHGGQVWAESQGVGQGARFIVRLPRLAAPPPTRILVVEDEAAVLAGISILLRDAGYAFTGAGTGIDALTALDASVPDLMILDIGLPDVDGWEVLRRIRNERRTQSLPVLVLTGRYSEEAEKAAALGADEFVTKPFSPRVLIGTMRDLLARRAGDLGR